MLTGNDDSLDDPYKLIRLLVKLMTRAGIVSPFHCLKALWKQKDHSFVGQKDDS
jgi:hypothetical protein